MNRLIDRLDEFNKGILVTFENLLVNRIRILKRIYFVSVIVNRIINFNCIYPIQYIVSEPSNWNVTRLLDELI